MRLGLFVKNEEHGKSPVELAAELRQVAAETRKRVVNNTNTEDQDARVAHLRDARGSVN